MSVSRKLRRAYIIFFPSSRSDPIFPIDLKKNGHKRERDWFMIETLIYASTSTNEINKIQSIDNQPIAIQSDKP